MTDGDRSRDSTFRLIYRSHNRIPESDRKAQLGSIFSVARSGNARKDVTGALLVHGDWFVQALEGDEDTVRGLYDHIYRDARHEAVQVLFADSVDGRAFGKWAMAAVGDEGTPDIRLIMNVTKGGAVPAAPQATTPEQEQVLDQMRDAVRADA